jgi:hypothetical protein
MRDVVRGRFTGRLDWRSRVRAGTLPAPARELVVRVVRRTRLWSLEKVEVADELVAHFTDALSSGTTIDEAIQQFGDERRTARLIRRAKRRNRPLVWQVARSAGWLVTLFLATYLGLLVRYFLGRPAPSVDYVALLNRRELAASAHERAWPLYREALLTIGNRQRDPQIDKQLNELLDARSGSEHWPAATQWLYAHQDALAKIRAGARMPVLGFIHGNHGSARDPEFWPNLNLPAAANDSNAEPVISVLLPHLNDMRRMANALSLDARLAQEQRDAARFLEDIGAMLGLARQLHGQDFLVTSLSSVGIRALALAAIEQMLLSSPELLNNSQLQKLAHELSGPRVAADLIDLGAERSAFYDAIQRIYTDDGAGDGRITPQGMRFLADVSKSWSPGAAGISDAPTTMLLAAPASLVGSRALVLREYDRFMDTMEAEFHHPLREVASNEAPASEKHLIWLREEPLRAFKYLPIVELAPGIHRAQWTAERVLARRDAIQTAIALELYRRQHGGFPDSLAALVPALLPRVPVDPITGEPLHYRLVDGKPLIYSVGADRDDDAGRVPLSRMGNPQAYMAAQWGIDPTTAPDGDWVLYPEPVVEMDGD